METGTLLELLNAHPTAKVRAQDFTSANETWIWEEENAIHPEDDVEDYCW